VDKETTVARKRVQDTATAIMREVEDITHGEQAQFSTRKPHKMFDERLYAIGDTQSHLESSDNGENGEDEEYDEEHTEHGNLNNNDEPGWVMCKISEMVPHHMESCRQKRIRLEELIQPGWKEVANHFRQSEMKYGMSQLKVRAVV
jgi:hypothetical protein